MCRGIVVGMMRGMGNRLGVHQPGDQHQAGGHDPDQNWTWRKRHGGGAQFREAARGADSERIRLTTWTIRSSVSSPPLMYSWTRPCSSMKTLTGKP
jgi:hypothetical protein